MPNPWYQNEQEICLDNNDNLTGSLNLDNIQPDALDEIAAISGIQPSALTPAVLWDLYARAYDNTTGEADIYEKLQYDAFRLLKNATVVRDIAAGTGNQTCLLARNGIRVDASDQHEQMLSRLQEKTKAFSDYVSVIREDMNRMVVKENTYDGIVVLNALYAAQKPYHVIDQAFKGLVPGGILVVSGPVPGADSNVIIKNIHDSLARKGLSERAKKDLFISRTLNAIIGDNFRNTYSTERMVELLEYAGFSAIVATDKTPTFETYLGQGFLVAAKKTKDYSVLKKTNIEFRLATHEEQVKTYRIAFHTLQERITNLPPDESKSQEEHDSFDSISDHYVAVHDDLILSNLRVVQDLRGKLPIDEFYSMDAIRTTPGAKIVEPGRWRRLAFAPKGVGTELFCEAFRDQRSKGATHWAARMDVELLDANPERSRSMGYKMDRKVEIDVNGVNRSVYIEIVDMRHPPAFFTNGPS